MYRTPIAHLKKKFLLWFDCFIFFCSRSVFTRIFDVETKVFILCKFFKSKSKGLIFPHKKVKDIFTHAGLRYVEI